MTLKLNRKTDYALVALSHLAERGAADEPSAISAREVADAYDMPRPLVMTILKQLHRAELVGSSRGPQGGYFLGRPAGRITVGMVIEAVEGPFRFALCCGEERAEADACRACELMGRCPIGESIRRLSERIETLLDSVTIEDLIHGRVEPPGDEAGSTARTMRHGLPVTSAT